MVLSKKDHFGYPASSFAFKAEDDTGFSVITDDSSKRPSDAGWVFVDAGTYTVTDGTFDLTLNEGSPTHWAYIRRIRLIPIAAPDASEQDAPVSVVEENEAERKQAEDALRALGYID
jgi:hypothetical protein